MRALYGVLIAAALLAPACSPSSRTAGKPAEAPRLVLFIGVDISGSFMRGTPYYDDALRFLAHYIYGHLHGMGGLEVPHSLFVGTIGGVNKDEPKTMYPIETFQHRSVEQIEAQLNELFPKKRENPFTDFNAYFEQVADQISARKLILKPVSIVLFTDGKPDLGGASKSERFRSIQLKPLENLSRNITLRVLYTDAVTAKSWRDEVPRRRVKVWTQDALVMAEWKDPKIFLADRPLTEQGRFFGWVRNNVDFQPRLQRVD